jgi:hypothetical protein
VRLREGSGQSKKNNALFVAQQLQGLDQRFIQLFSIDTSSDRHERKGGESDYRMVKPFEGQDNIKGIEFRRMTPVILRNFNGFAGIPQDI